MNKTLPLQIAIDGPVAAGKSVVAKKLADRLHLDYLNTGLMYRLLGLYVQRNNVAMHNDSAVTAQLRTLCAAEFNSLTTCIHAFHKHNQALHASGITEIASAIAMHSAVRTVMVAAQKQLIKAPTTLRSGNLLCALSERKSRRSGNMLCIPRSNDRGIPRRRIKGKNIVVEGRDIGAIVMPNATLKIYLTATFDKRVARRVHQLEQNNVSETKQEVQSSIRGRDIQDSSRVHNPLIKAADAITIDTTALSVDEVVMHIAELLVKKS